jgi:2',3'-cyclic-nucleotide 2'-phosphodiesterase (5'-nucleotidase family)
MRRIIYIILAIAIACPFAGLTYAAALEPDYPTPALTVLFTNGEQGYFSDTQRNGENVIGADVTARYKKNLGETRPVLLISMGNIVPLIPKERDGQRAVDIMNAAGYDAMLVAANEKKLDFGAFSAAAGFSLISSEENDLRDYPTVQAYAAFEFPDLRVCVIDVEFPGGGSPELTEEITSKTRNFVKQLREEADIIICLSNGGLSRQFLDDAPGIDLAISHSSGASPLIASVKERGTELGQIDFYQENSEVVINSFDVFTKNHFSDAKRDPDVLAAIEKWAEPAQTPKASASPKPTASATPTETPEATEIAKPAEIAEETESAESTQLPEIDERGGRFPVYVIVIVFVIIAAVAVIIVKRKGRV